jgi:hypothetical protein
VVRKLLTVTLPALAAAALLLGVGVEAWVRLRWDERRGTPGFYAADAVRGQRLTAGYRGWFAGVPVYVNNLGLRADRDYRLDKRSNTFRILVLGDSVTFGHGSVFDNTWPHLLEVQLQAWRPDIDWQVWNAGVPGYNTSQELATLLEVGPVFKPDLVIVGFFSNDVIDNHPLRAPGRTMRWAARAKNIVQLHVRSVELYKRLFLTFAYRLSASESYKRMLEHLPTESLLLDNPGAVQDLAEQQLTPVTRLSDADVSSYRCIYGEKPDPKAIADLQRDPGWPDWVAAVRQFQTLHQSGAYRVVFFVNMAPLVCMDDDRFYDGGSGLVNQFLLRELSKGTPALSSHDEYLHYLPSQMPLAQGHSLGNSNRVKATVLFEFLRDRVLIGERLHRGSPR